MSSSSDKSVDKMHPRYLYLKTLDKTLPLNEKLMSDKFFFRLKIIETVLSTLTFNFNLSKKLSILLSKTCNTVELGESKTRSSAYGKIFILLIPKKQPVPTLEIFSKTSSM